eukprot:gene13790-biopygen11269
MAAAEMLRDACRFADAAGLVALARASRALRRIAYSGRHAERESVRYTGPSAVGPLYLRTPFRAAAYVRRPAVAGAVRRGVRGKGPAQRRPLVPVPRQADA